MHKEFYREYYEIEDKHWWFVGRRAILGSFLKDIIHRLRSRSSIDGKTPVIADTPDTLRILDVGCGTGANLEMLLQYGSAEGVDVSDDALEFCEAKGLSVKKGLAEKLPYEDGAFDVTTALDVVEHLDDVLLGR